MERHITLLGILFICYHTAVLVAAFIVWITFIGIGLISASALRHALDFIPYMPLGLLNFIGWFITIILLVVSLPGFIAGVGLIRFKSWSRILAMIVAVFNLFNFPIGTALGVYALWVLLSPESAKLLSSGGKSSD